MARVKFDIGAGLRHRDARDVPTYSIHESAHYLNIPPATIRAWVLGRSYSLRDGSKQQFRRVLELPDPKSKLLSFYNLVEAHILRGLRTEHNVKLQPIRAALNYVEKHFGWKRPLIEHRFQTDGAALLVERLGKLIDVSAQGQVVMKQLVDAHLQRLEWENDVVTRLYPFTRPREIVSPKTVFIDPRYSFGRPVLSASHIPTAVLAERYKAGDSIDHLMHDYGCTRPEIEEGLRCELEIQAAA